MVVVVVVVVVVVLKEVIVVVVSAPGQIFHVKNYDVFANIVQNTAIYTVGSIRPKANQPKTSAFAVL